MHLKFTGMQFLNGALDQTVSRIKVLHSLVGKVIYLIAFTHYFGSQ